jgi:hypothetical protein
VLHPRQRPGRLPAEQGPVGVVPRQGSTGEVVGAGIPRVDPDGAVEGTDVHQELFGQNVRGHHLGVGVGHGRLGTERRREAKKAEQKRVSHQGRVSPGGATRERGLAEPGARPDCEPSLTNGVP